MNLRDYAERAARTMPADMDPRARLAMLSMGLFGEWHELLDLSPGQGGKLVKEMGDVYWYSVLLATESRRVFGMLGYYDSMGTVRPKILMALPPESWQWVEAAKKAIFHDVHPGALALWVEKSFQRLEMMERFYSIDKGEVLRQNIEKLEKRYPDGFESGGGQREGAGDAENS